MLLVQVSVSNDSGHPGACKAVLEVEYRGEAADPTAGRMRRVAAAKARHNVNWTEPSGGDVDDGAEYRMEFGKYSGGKGLTVQQVQAKDPGYFKHLMSWRTSILVTYPRLKDALEESGLLEALVTARPELQREKAELVLMRAEDRASRQERGPKEHPEIFKKRRLQQIEASSVLTGQQKDDAMALAAASARPTKKKQKERKYEAKPSTLLGHCSRCGGIGHNRTTCKLKDLQGDGIPQQTLIEWAYEQNKTLAALISRLKYTNISGRSDMYEQRPHQRSRAPLQRSFLEMLRAVPGDLATMLEEDGLVDPKLDGVPCPRRVCQESLQEGFLTDAKVLGKKRVNNAAGQDLSTRTVFRKCQVCGVRQGIALYNPLFEGLVGRASYGVTYAVLCMWNCVEGADQTYTARQLNINPKTVAQYYARAQDVMSAEAYRLQEEIEWGTGTDDTVEVELDATVVFKWKVRDQVSGVVTFYYYCPLVE